MAYYHVWFATRSRKWLLQGDIPETVKALFREISSIKGISLIECEAIVDHVHLLVDCEDKSSLSRAMHLLKGISSRRLFEMYPDIKLDAHTEHFWQKGYGSKIVPDSALSTTRRYIQTQWDRLDSFDRPNALSS